LKSHKKSELNKGLRSLGDAFFKARDAMKACKGVPYEIRKLE